MVTGEERAFTAPLPHVRLNRTRDNRQVPKCIACFVSRSSSNNTARVIVFALIIDGDSFPLSYRT